MDSVDLNIIQRGLAGSSWTAEKGVIDAASLHKIGEQRTDNSGALNALPTPFARFFVVNEAFRRLYEQKIDANKSAGLAYEWLVSDCLDIYELLFNQEYHRARDEKIVIKEWVREESLAALKRTVPILGNAVDNYYADDLGNDTSTLYFVVFMAGGKDYLLGTSSPMTGFVTPPDLDKKVKDKVSYFVGDRYKDMPKLKRKGNHGHYFKDIRLFDQRSEEFKNYMYNNLFGGGVDDRMGNIRDYIKAFSTDQDIKNNYSLELKPVKTEEYNSLEINNIRILCNNDIGNYFNDAIIKIPYRIAPENFFVPDVEGDHKYDYLLPLSEEAILRLDLDKVVIRYKESTTKLSVSLSVNGKEYKKDYYSNNVSQPDSGKIIDLSLCKVNFDMALFPKVRLAKKEENNYYKLMLVAKDDNDRPTFSVDDITCDFFVKNDNGGCDIIEEASDEKFKSGVRRPSLRSIQGENSACGTKYYELFNSAFDLIRFKIRLEGCDYSGVLIPKWQDSVKNQKSYVYAIDFGTTNTFISRCERGMETRPEQLKMNKPIVSYLHAKPETRRKSEIDLWEDVPTVEFLDYFQTEFVPAFIDGERYKFPLRTAICKTADEKNAPRLFDNRNIAFSYGHKKAIGNHEILTDIKWNEDNAKVEAGLFIQELLMVIKYDILQENADLSNTQLIWFRPLSFKGSVRDMFEKLWADKAKDILGIGGQQVVCYTESEAPYYYFQKKNEFKSVSSVTVIDIGGGSTDMVYFENGNPKLANSVHFGCDVLWGNGYNQFVDAEDNGIYKHYKDIIRFKKQELKELNDYLLSSNSRSSTKDIINFWLEQDEETELTDKLQKDYRPLFLYHYAAIIFYLAEMLKAKGLSCPRAILFSGNGSRYIDNFITKDVDGVLHDLTMIILKDVFPECEDVQLILPEDRKESTCYGGLYRKESDKSATPYVFMGVDGTQYQDVEAIKGDFENGLCDKLLSQVEKLNGLYLKMLSTMISKLQLDGIKTDEIKNCISTGIKDALQTDFQKEVLGKYDMSVPLGDSLFFLPIVDQILKLTKKK